MSDTTRSNIRSVAWLGCCLLRAVDRFTAFSSSRLLRRCAIRLGMCSFPVVRCDVAVGVSFWRLLLAPAPFAFLTTAAGGAFFLVCGSFFICKVSGSSRVRAEVRACKSHFFEGGSDPTVVVLLVCCRSVYFVVLSGLVLLWILCFLLACLLLF
jgi:hypothetical protein